MENLPCDDVLLNEIRRKKLEKAPKKPVVIPNDGYHWLKYGQKDLARTKLRRGYFKCSLYEDHNCTAKLQISYKQNQPKFSVVKYEGKHNHSRANSPVQLTRNEEGRSAADYPDSQQTPFSRSHSASQERQRALQSESLAAPFQWDVAPVSVTTIVNGDSSCNVDFLQTEKNFLGLGKWNSKWACGKLERRLSDSNNNHSSTRPSSSTHMEGVLNSSMASQKFRRNFRVGECMDGKTIGEKHRIGRTGNEDRLSKKSSLPPFPSNKPTSSVISTPIGKFLTSCPD